MSETSVKIPIHKLQYAILTIKQYGWKSQRFSQSAKERDERIYLDIVFDNQYHESRRMRGDFWKQTWWEDLQEKSINTCQLSYDNCEYIAMVFDD